MPDTSRLIEHAFPLKQASLDSVHEKNVRHGHISTLHIWPARRPLAASRAALLATLLPDPGTPEKRRELCEKIAGTIVKKIERKKMPNGEVIEREKEGTAGGILRWGRETENKAHLDWFRGEVRKAYGGKAPKVLDPFAGGGAIPLEAMRLGCEVTAVDINPVAWFILKCTLEYPQRLVGQTLPLPDFILENEDFMEAFYKEHPHLVGRTKPTKKQLKSEGDMLPGMTRHREENARAPKADLAWHVRAWGHWVLDRARKDLAKFYPTYADFEPLDKRSTTPYEKQPMRLVPVKKDGRLNVQALNKDFSEDYLSKKANPRWVAKPTVAYLWARTVKCKNCRIMMPLLKTRWLCKKDNKRILLSIRVTDADVAFEIEQNVPVRGGNAAQRREHDRILGAGTMSASGAACPGCKAISTMQDLRLEGQSGRLGCRLLCVVVEGQKGKEFRLPHLGDAATISEKLLSEAFESIPGGRLLEEIPKNPRRFATPLYGMRTFESLFTDRQLLAMATLTRTIRGVPVAMKTYGNSDEWQEAILAYLALVNDRQADYCSAICTWHNSREQMRNTFGRFALPMVWDYCEVNPISNTSGNFLGALEWVARVCEHFGLIGDQPMPRVLRASATASTSDRFDLVVTDPPYYDAIPYSDISNFFYVWLRRTVGDRFGDHFSAKVIPYDGELVMDRMHKSLARPRTKVDYEAGMATAFARIHEVLAEHGRFVIVFAHKHPDAWETLVSAIIRSGFIVDGSWPMQTEMGNRANALGTASLASSVWLVCRKRPGNARPGWDNQVLEEMRRNIRTMLREFWDAGIRGPDFVWAATGPALEAYSKHPVVKKANDPGPMTVGEFLTHVRRMVVDFVVGRVLAGDKDAGAELAATDRLDEPTAYYLLHRHDFGMNEAPAGACILYAISCGMSDKELAHTWDLIAFTKGKAAEEFENEDADADAEADEVEEDSGSKVKLKTWAQRKGRSLGYEAPGGKPVPLIDRIHRLMHLWKAGDLHKVDEYLDSNGLRRQELFKRLLQSLIELSPHASEERSLLESISNHVQARGALREQGPVMFDEEEMEKTRKPR